jgi:hypothetical protein
MKNIPKVPKGMMLIGHAKGYDVYQSKRGIIYHYIGRNEAHYKNPRFWVRMSKVV